MVDGALVSESGTLGFYLFGAFFGGLRDTGIVFDTSQVGRLGYAVNARAGPKMPETPVFTGFSQAQLACVSLEPQPLSAKAGELPQFRSAIS